jgi:hypothetical protein
MRIGARADVSGRDPSIVECAIPGLPVASQKFNADLYQSGVSITDIAMGVVPSRIADYTAAIVRSRFRVGRLMITLVRWPSSLVESLVVVRQDDGAFESPEDGAIGAARASLVGSAGLPARWQTGHMSPGERGEREGGAADQ